MGDEQEMVDAVEALQDDADAWGDPVPPPKRSQKSERRQRGAMVSVRLTIDELAKVQKQADEQGLSVSGYLRTVALNVAQRHVVTATWTAVTATNSNLSNTAAPQVLGDDMGTSWSVSSRRVQTLAI